MATRGPLRWGIVSAGKISEDFVIALSTLPVSDHVVVAVATRDDQSRATKFATKHGIPAAFGNYSDLSRCKTVDVVYIGALNPQHFEIAKLMLENGKHVLCEKPLCMNKQQAQKLVSLARSYGRFLMEGVWSRFLPAYQYLRSQIDDGALGSIESVEVSFGFPLEHVDRLTQKEQGGGVVYDLGIYTIQLSQWVFREPPLSIESVGELNDEGTDLDVKSKMTYSGGRTARMHMTARAKLQNRAIVKGSKGQITLLDFWTPNKLIDVDGTEKLWPPPKAKMTTNYANSECLRYEAEATRQSILAGELENQHVSHAESLLFAEIEDTIRTQIGALNKHDNA